MWGIEATDARCGRPILIDSRCLAAISRYTALRQTLSMSVASAAVAMSGFMIMFLSGRVRFIRRRGSGFPVRLLSRSKVVPGCTFCASRRCRVLLGWWEAVSPAWSFWRWISWAGDPKGLE
jgi:hypothetical protein